MVENVHLADILKRKRERECVLNVANILMLNIWIKSRPRTLRCWCAVNITTQHKTTQQIHTYQRDERNKLQTQGKNSQIGKSNNRIEKSREPDGSNLVGWVLKCTVNVKSVKEKIVPMLWLTTNWPKQHKMYTKSSVQHS